VVLLSRILLIALVSLAGCVSAQPYTTKKAVTSIAFSPDHLLLAFADANEVHVIEVDSKRHLRTLRALPKDIEGADPQLFRHGVGDNLVFLDNTRVASTGMGGLVSIWDVHSGNRLAVIEPLSDEEFASTIDYSEPANRLVVGTSSGQVLLTTLTGDNAGPLVPLTQLDGYIWDLQFSRDGRFLASASLTPGKPPRDEVVDEPADGFARSMNNEEQQSTVSHASGEPADEFAQANTGRQRSPSNVIIWNAEVLEKVGVLHGAVSVFGMSLVPGEQALLTAGEDVQIWEFLTRQQSGEVSDPSMVMQAIGMGTMAVVSLAGLSAGVLPPVDLLAQTVLSGGFPFIPTHAFIRHACARAAAISPDGEIIVTTTWGSTHNVMAVIDRAQNKVIEKWTADGSVCDMEFSPDGRYLVAATSRGGFIFDTTNWKKTKLTKLIVPTGI